jgi:hypothetical protein
LGFVIVIQQRIIPASDDGSLCRYGTLIAVGFLFCFVSGCGGTYDATAVGTVTLDGKIVPRGTVSFAPIKGGPIANGLIGENGSYTAQTGREAGLPAGEYQVTVFATELPAPERVKPGVPPPDGKPITPEWYRSSKTSGLKYTVERGKNKIDLELTSQPPAGWKSRGQL